MTRIVDPEALARARVRWDECASCGRPPANVDHVLPRGAPHFGDDVDGNLILLCGSGTTGCHGARHGIPFTDPLGRVRSPQDVRRSIGRQLCTRRPDVVAYVLEKLGEEPGLDYLRRYYYAEVG